MFFPKNNHYIYIYLKIKGREEEKGQSVMLLLIVLLIRIRLQHLILKLLYIKIICSNLKAFSPRDFGSYQKIWKASPVSNLSATKNIYYIQNIQLKNENVFFTLKENV